jgi:hypothetical protein
MDLDRKTPEGPRLPRWGRLVYSDRGRPRGFGGGGCDDAMQAVRLTRQFIDMADRKDSPWLLLRLEDPERNHPIPEHVLELQVDQDFGPTDDDIVQVQRALVACPVAPPLVIRVVFTRDGKLLFERGPQVHLALEVRSSGPTWPAAEEEHRVTTQLREGGASRCNVKPTGPCLDTLAEAFAVSRNGLDLCANCFHPRGSW